MASRPDGFGAALTELILEQEGLVARQQLLAAGMTRSQAWQRIRTGRWQALDDGVYATFTGPLDDQMKVWAALLAVGEPAAASHRTALWLDGLLPEPPDVVQVSVPNGLAGTGIRGGHCWSTSSRM